MSNTKNILVTGANGQLGTELRQVENAFKAYRFLFTSREELDITDNSSVENYFTANQIDYCINCAAYTAVDKAEKEKEKAIKINVTAAANLAAVCKKFNAVFFHFSTDYVFDGTAKMPYKETDAPVPVNFYGQTKLDGEKEAIKQNEHTIIIRTSWVYSSHGNNFVKTMLRLMCEKESVAVVYDQYGSPTYAADLADAVMKIISAGKPAKGIYHYCNNGIISWYDFAAEIKKLINSKCKVNAINTAAYPTAAKRPQYSALDSKKIQEEYNLEIPGWKVSLEKCIKLFSL